MAAPLLMREPVTVTDSVAASCAYALPQMAEVVMSAATDVQSRSDVEIFMDFPQLFLLYLSFTMA
jgi:hypothetical protein